MYKYQKKPVVVEAFQMTEKHRWDNSEWPVWLHEAWNMEMHEPGALFPSSGREEDDTLLIITLEGIHSVSWDDWIIKGVQGEIYPCKPDIFTATYEKVPESRDVPGSFLSLIAQLEARIEKEIDCHQAAAKVVNNQAAHIAQLERVERAANLWKRHCYHGTKKQINDAENNLLAILPELEEE